MGGSSRPLLTSHAGLEGALRAAATRPKQAGAGPCSNQVPAQVAAAAFLSLNRRLPRPPPPPLNKLED